MSYPDQYPPPPGPMAFYQSLPPPPPPPEMPPLPPGPPPDIFRFYGSTSEPHSAPMRDHQQNQFSYRNNAAPEYPSNYDQHQTSRYQKVPVNGQVAQTASSNPVDSYRPGRGAQSRGGRSGYGARRGRGSHNFHPADRPLLRFQRGSTPEQMPGMQDEQTGRNRFMPADDVSDSEEEEMEESEPETYEPELETNLEAQDAVIVPGSEEPALIMEPLAKRQTRPSDKDGSKDGETIPKWSNPELYTALPPVDESQRKKKDFVKLIRKARRATEKHASPQTQLATADEFISLDFGDEKPQEDEENSGGDESQIGRVPSGPRNSLPDQKNRELNSRNVPGQTHNQSTETDFPHPPKRKRGPNAVNSQSLLDDWIPDDASKSAPWLTHFHDFTENAGFRLHKEICDFYDFVKPKKYEQVIREDLLHRLRRVIGKYISGCDVRSFGSFAAGLYLPNADMDLVVISREYMNGDYPTVFRSNNSMHRLAAHLKNIGVADPSSTEVIAHAKVPLVKFVDRTTGLRVDMSFENDTGLVANATFDRWKLQFPAMPILVTLIKQFLMMRGLNEVVNGGLGGFSVTCLVTSLLQNMPRVQSGDLVPEQHLGEILLEFLDLYGNQLDIVRTGISMDPPGYFEKKIYGNRFSQNSKANRLAIIDPNKADNDISGGSRNVMLIFERFAQAHHEIMQIIKTPDRHSLLDTMLGGNYESFLWQRNRLWKLYQAYEGIPESQPTDSLIETPPQRINHSVSVRDVAPAMPLQPHSTNTRVHLSNNIASNTANVGGPEKTENSFDKDKKEARLITVDEKRKRRYEALKRDYPDMEDIPQILGKGRRKKLIAEYNAKHGLQAPPPPEPRLPPDPTTLRRSRRLEKIRAAASLEPQPEDEESREGRQTRTARWAALRHEADMGRSRRNPITIE